MPPKALNNNQKKDGPATKNDYARDLIERLRKLRSGTINETNIDLNKVSVKQLITLIGQNVDNRNSRLNWTMVRCIC